MRLFLCVFLSAATVTNVGYGQSAKSSDAHKKTKPKSDAPNLVTFTGCVDQRGENYVLANDRNLKTEAILHGDGFSDDNFARHLGHQVSIRGTLTTDADPKVISVKKIDDVADACAPE